MKSVKLLYFSPTGTTKKIVREIAKGMGAGCVESIDCTEPAIRSGQGLAFQDELAILGAPVYYGRVQADAANFFKGLTAAETPAVIVVVYGNRAYDDALGELRDIALDRGFNPIAGGAFIGEHSYSLEAAPIAHGRPDTKDLEIAREFGAKIRGKLDRIAQVRGIEALDVPGNFPYRAIRPLPKMSPTTREALCLQCGTCVQVCPTGAVSQGDAIMTERDKCILCCACIKACPSGARVMESPAMREIMEWLYRTCQERKEPEIFL